MPLVHPRVSIFLAALVIAYLVASSYQKGRKVVTSVARLIAISAASGLIISPWIVRQWGAHHAQLSVVGSGQQIDFPFGLMTAGADRYVLGLAMVGLAIAAIQRLELLALFGTWAVLVVISANPTTFRVPVYLWVNNDSVAIAAFLPAAILSGYAIARLADLARFDRWFVPARYLTGAMVVVAAFSQA